MNTPWGHAQTVEVIAPGITFVSTPSHGGILLSEELARNIPADRRAWAARWSGSELAFEEDSAIAFVYVAFPVYFPETHVRYAEETVRRLIDRGEIAA